jgi:cytochrome b561
MRNTDHRYGWMTKLLHWAIFALVVNQFIVGPLMMRTPAGETFAGFTQGGLYNWHKSIGLVAFVVAAIRLAWRKLTPLPDWAPNLGAGERRAIHRVERLLYACMFLMPASGFVFVMAGDFGVNVFSAWEMPRFIPPHARLASAAQWTHKVAAWTLGITLVAHWSIVARHQYLHRDRYVQRMLPFTHQR